MTPAMSKVITATTIPYINTVLFNPKIRIASERVSDHDFAFDLDRTGDLLKSGVLVVNSSRKILAGSRLAYELLQDSEGLALVAGCLVIEKAYVQRSFDVLLQQLRTATMAGSINSAQFPCIGVPDQKGTVRYVLRVIDAQANGLATDVLLAVTDLLDRAGGSKAVFSAAFRLSEREAELAELFSRGFRLEEISSKMNVSLNTARVHLRNVFAKTNCSGQSELMRMFSRLSCFIAPMLLTYV